MGTENDSQDTQRPVSRRDAIRYSSVAGLAGGSYLDQASNRASHASTARQNYQTLADDIDELGTAPGFDIVVIGSGYGGSIMAARIAQAMKRGTSMCVVEMGKEWVPGDFPETMGESIRETTLAGPPKQKLLELKHMGGCSVLRGIGLGGGSLINASVAIRPDDEIFEKNWPTCMTGRSLDKYFTRASRTLRLFKSFDGENSSPKMDFMEDLGRKVSGSTGYRGYQRLDLTTYVTKDNIGRRGRTRTFHNEGAPVKQAPSTLHGNCMNGDNTGAKNTTATSYLPIAKKHGAKIFSGYRATQIEKLGERDYLIHGEMLKEGRRYSKTIRASYVVVSAGTIGTNELLMQSTGSLAISAMLGKRFNGNGDTLAMVNHADRRINPVGFGTSQSQGIPARKDDRAGLGIQSALDFRGRKDPFLLEDLTYPKAVSAYLQLINPMAKPEQMMSFLIMSKDTLDGELSMSRTGQLKAKWPFDIPKSTVDFLRSHLTNSIDDRMQFVGRGVFDMQVFGRRITAHPLGGAPMGDSPDQGVVDAKGRLYNAKTGGVHRGLYVADGSVIPTCLLANPFLTISAVSEWIAQGFIQDPSNSEVFA